MEKSEDHCKFLIFQACFLSIFFAPAGYVLPVQLHPALWVALIIKVQHNDSPSYCFDVFIHRKRLTNTRRTLRTLKWSCLFGKVMQLLIASVNLFSSATVMT